MYDEFSSNYDRFVNWPARLAYELPWIEATLNQLNRAGDFRLLDTACGTGMHTIELAKRGYKAAGADLSVEMIQQARENARRAGVSIRFEPVGFGNLQASFGDESFEALLCLGNSLPHVLNEQELDRTLQDFAACLQPGGLLLLQNRNFDAVLQNRERWMEPQNFRDKEHEWLFVRFYDYDSDGKITFNILTLDRDLQGSWQQKPMATRLWPLTQRELLSALHNAGFVDATSYGDLEGSTFDPHHSPNLVLTARKG